MFVSSLLSFVFIKTTVSYTAFSHTGFYMLSENTTAKYLHLIFHFNLFQEHLKLPSYIVLLSFLSPEFPNSFSLRPAALRDQLSFSRRLVHVSLALKALVFHLLSLIAWQPKESCVNTEKEREW